MAGVRQHIIKDGWVPGVVDSSQREQQRLDWQAKRAIVLGRQALPPPPAGDTSGGAQLNATAGRQLKRKPNG